VIHPTPPAGRPRRPRRWRWVLLSVGGTVLMAVGGVLLHHAWRCHVAGQELQAAVAELDRADPRWRYEDVEADRKSPPEGRNSADVALAAQRLLPRDFPSRAWYLADTDPGAGDRVSAGEKFESWPGNVRLDAALVQGLCAELLAGEAALAEARRLDGLPEGRYPLEHKVDYLNTLVPHLDRIRGVVWLLTADATFRAQEGDLAGAWVSLRAAVNGARSIGDDPSLIAVLVRTATVTWRSTEPSASSPRGRPRRPTWRHSRNCSSARRARRYPPWRRPCARSGRWPTG
jgi:hypothetical protein